MLNVPLPVPVPLPGGGQTARGRRFLMRALWLAAAVAAATPGCDDPALPSFANPPPVDAGLDGAADTGTDAGSDEDGGAD